MSFKPIRTFLANRILEIDSDFEAHSEVFTDENIGDNDFNKRYHIFYGNIQTTVSNQTTTQDTVTATVSLYFKGYNDRQEAVDNALDFANQYRMRCLRPEYLREQQFIKRVTCTQIVAEPLDTNIGAIKVILTFNISVIFGHGINLDC